MSNLEKDFCRLLYDQTDIIIVGLDCHCRVVTWNASAERTFKLKQKDALGKEVSEVLPKEIRAELGQACRRAIATGTKSIESGRAEVELRLTLGSDDGPKLELSAKVRPLYDANGKTTACVIWAEDITRLRQLERELAASERLASLGTLAGGVAHHFNNILGGVSTFVDYALESDDPRAARRALQMTAQAAERAANITKSLLAFAQKDAGGEDLADLTEVVLTFASLVEKSLAEKHIKLDLELRPVPVVPVRVDWMHTVLGNLLDNAEDAMSNGGRVDIEVGSDQKTVWLRFTDEGVGINPDDWEHIFEPFYTTKGLTGSGQQNKAGLGLAVVHGLVKEMHGEIDVSSTPGGGATFRIRFARPKTPEADKP
ncbi:MAG: PAS domain-containing protein [Actinobacteria bacterium]|nr:PAS domain-containing protein [Actinomycetota bacterium]